MADDPIGIYDGSGVFDELGDIQDLYLSRYLAKS
jgi:hypothetical protein